MASGFFSCKTSFVIYPFFFLIISLTFITYYYQNICTFSSSSSPSMAPLVSHFCNPSYFLHHWKYFNNSSGKNNNDDNRKELSDIMKVEKILARCRSNILEAVHKKSYGSFQEGDFLPMGSVYRNPYAFHQSHKEMEKHFKIWVYEEGEPPIFHDGPMNDIYSIEGQFLDELVSGKSPFLTNNPNEAIGFYVPVSVTNIVQYVYWPYDNYSRERLQNIVKDYIDLISHRYPHWNHSRGADHFLLSCHDWAPDVSAAHPKLFKNMIRGLCNANSSEGFEATRDISLPEIKIPYQQFGPPYLNNTPNNRSILAFFAGGSHGIARQQLLSHWKDKDNEIQVHEYIPKNLDYFSLMGQSKYCLCPSGFEVASPRIVESMHVGCVPVIISDYYVLPFSDVLDWTQFSVHVPISMIPKIKEILKGISFEDYLEKQRNVIKVQRHFMLHRPAKPYDIFYMVMHSLWLRRLNSKLF